MSQQNVRLLWRQWQQNCSKFVLKNGSTIAWNEIGSPTGFPIIYFHGANACRLEGTSQHEACLKNNIKLITLDRPGHGQSTLPLSNWYTSHQSYTCESYCNDLIDWMDHLGLESNNFGISGYSMGGAFAMSQMYYLAQKNLIPRFGLTFCGLPFANMNILNTASSDTSLDKTDTPDTTDATNATDARDITGTKAEESETKETEMKTDVTREVMPPYFQRMMRVYEKYPRLVHVYGNKLSRWLLLNRFDDAINIARKDNAFCEIDNQQLECDLPNWDDINGNPMKVKQLLQISFIEGVTPGIDGMLWSLDSVYNCPFSDNIDKMAKFRDIPIDMHYCQEDGTIPIEWAKVYYNQCKHDFNLNVNLFEYPNTGHLLWLRTDIYDNALKRCKELYL